MSPVCVNVTRSILSFMTCFEILKLFVVDETLKEITQFSTLGGLSTGSEFSKWATAGH